PDHVPVPADAGLSVGGRRASRLKMALGLNVAMVVVQLVAGWRAHSLGLLSDAGHNLADVLAVGASLIAVNWAARKPTAHRSYGYHRGTILAALANAASILAVTIFIVYEAIQRLVHPQSVSGGIVVAVALAATAVNGLAAFALRESHAGHAHAAGPADLNMRSAALHMVADALASLGVAVAGLVIWLSGRYFWLDPVVSLGIGLLIAIEAYRLLREAVDVLLESTPNDVDLEGLQRAIEAVPGIDEVHDLHVWSLSSEMRALSGHLLISGHPSLEEAQRVGAQAKAMVAQRFAIAHATLELECEACYDEPRPDCAINDAPAPSSHDHHHH
ncbi:MAG: cation diffusion facilitator family transporter, partial [Acidimicrobiia bacterium]|nr:cation diffusion facilitator family transporter [Acidimicrobiia bacterium]